LEKGKEPKTGTGAEKGTERELKQQMEH